MRCLHVRIIITPIKCGTRGSYTQSNYIYSSAAAAREKLSLLPVLQSGHNIHTDKKKIACGLSTTPCGPVVRAWVSCDGNTILNIIIAAVRHTDYARNRRPGDNANDVNANEATVVCSL